jgi:hypothetical protein
MRRLLWVLGLVGFVTLMIGRPPAPDIDSVSLSDDDSACDPSYPDVCIPSPPPDLDCADVPYRDFRVVGADPHHFDGDRDGRGCEPFPARDRWPRGHRGARHR